MPKSATIEKSILPNTRYTIWNIDRGKSTTTGKSLTSDTRYTIGDSDRGKSATIVVFTTDYYSIFYR